MGLRPMGRAKVGTSILAHSHEKISRYTLSCSDIEETLQSASLVSNVVV